MSTITAARHEFEIVTTHDLKVGDVIRQHGGTFLLTELAVRRPGETDIQGDTLAFRTEFLGDAHERGGCPIPAAWIAEGWIVQGNRLARWARYVW